MAPRSTKATGAQQAAPATDTPRESASGPADENLSSVGRGEDGGTGTAPHAAAPLIEAAKAARVPAPDEPVRRTYPVLSPLRRDHRLYRPDDPAADTIELTEAEAETLVALGVLGEPEA